MKIQARQTLLQRISWRLILDVVSRGTFFVIAVVVGRMLSVQDFGKYGYALSIVFFGAIFIDLGTNLQMMKELGAQRGKNDGLWRDYWNLKLVLLGSFSILFLLVIPFIWKWNHPWILFLALIWMYGNSLGDFIQIVCNSIGRMDLARNALMVQRGLVLVCVVGSLIIKPQLELLFFGMSIGAIFGTFFSTRILFQGTRQSLQFSLDWDNWKKILKLSLPNALTVTFATWYLRLGAIFLAWFWSARHVGEYSAAFRIFEITYIFAAAVMNIGSPHLSEMYHQKREIFKREIVKIFTLMLLMGTLWSSFLFFSSSQVISLLFGTKYLPAVPILKLFGLVSFILFFNHVMTHLLIIVDQQRRLAFFEGLAFTLGLVFYILFIPKSSGQGAAVSLLGIEAFLFLMTGGYLFHRVVRGRLIGRGN